MEQNEAAEEVVGSLVSIRAAFRPEVWSSAIAQASVDGVPIVGTEVRSCFARPDFRVHPLWMTPSYINMYYMHVISSR